MSDELISEIEAAWATAVPPSDGIISRPTYDDEGTADYFRGKTWRGHTAKQLRQLDFALTIFTAEAFAYYLPAYMVADLQEPGVADILIEFMQFSLSPSQSANPERTARILGLLSPAQKSAVQHYFQHVRDRDGECIAGEYDEVLSLGASSGQTA